MWTSRRLCHRGVVFATVVLPIEFIRHKLYTTFDDISHCDNENSISKQKSEFKHENLAMYLKPESKVILKTYLQERNLQDRHVEMVCFARDATEDERYIFRPLFGQRAAFRLKGIIQTESGLAVGVGRLSNMVGEILNDEYVACLPMFTDREKVINSDSDIAATIDLPTRYFNMQGAKLSSYWKGRLPPTTIRGTYHPAMTQVTYTPLPKNKQIVLEGYVCSDKYINADGSCSYERSEEEEEALLRAVQDQSTSPADNEATTTSAAGVTAAVEEDKDECPVCRYIKAGPCKAEFLAWDACVQAMKEEDDLTRCFGDTCTMMNCMKKYEYYDMMTAGTDFSKMEEAEKARKEQTQTQTQDEPS